MAAALEALSVQEVTVTPAEVKSQLGSQMLDPAPSEMGVVGFPLAGGVIGQALLQNCILQPLKLPSHPGH